MDAGRTREKVVDKLAVAVSEKTEDEEAHVAFGKAKRQAVLYQRQVDALGAVEAAALKEAVEILTNSAAQLAQAVKAFEAGRRDGSQASWSKGNRLAKQSDEDVNRSADAVIAYWEQLGGAKAFGADLAVEQLRLDYRTR